MTPHCHGPPLPPPASGLGDGLLPAILSHALAAFASGDAAAGSAASVPAAAGPGAGAALDLVEGVAFTLVAMGHESVSSLVSWALYLLAVHPQEQQRWVEARTLVGVIATVFLGR